MHHLPAVSPRFAAILGLAVVLAACGGSPAAPSAAPATVPATTAPSPAPTVAPTAPPTLATTPVPTLAPTASATAAPTPTVAPTATATPVATTEPQPSESASPSPDGSLPPVTDDQAAVLVSGDVNATLALAYDAGSSTFPTNDGTGFEQVWKDANGDVLRVTLDMAAGQIASAFVAVGAPGSSIDDSTYFADFFRSNCEVILDHLDATSFSGSLTCLHISNGADTQSVDVRGAFSAVK